MRWVVATIGSVLAVFLFVATALAAPKNAVLVSCPSYFPGPNPQPGRKLRLIGAETWTGIQSPIPSEVNGYSVDYVNDGTSPFHLRCTYTGNRQITIPIPKEATTCLGRRDRRGQLKVVCVGPAPESPLPPPQIFIAHPVDYSVSLLGFGLRQTPQQIADIAQARDLPIRVREEMDNGTARVVEITVAAKMPLTILFSPQTGLSREVVQNLDGVPPDGNAVLQGTLGFGDFTELNAVPKGASLYWDQKTGVVLLAECGPEKNAPGHLRLIDDAQVSKEQGVPQGAKKYFPPHPGG